MLHHEGTERFLRQMFPPLADAPAWVLALCGMTLLSKEVRPNDPDPLPDFVLNPATTAAELTQEVANEGGAPCGELRGWSGYVRMQISFSVDYEADGAAAKSNELAYVHAITWDRHGTWVPPEQEPWRFRRTQWAQDVGFPWQVPNVKPDFFADDDFGHFLAANLFRVGGYPISLGFVLDQAGKLLASSQFRRAFLWRPGGGLYLDFRARLHAPLMSRAFARLLGRAGFSGLREVGAFAARPVLNAPGTLGPRTTLAELLVSAELPAHTLGPNWTYEPGQAGPPPAAPYVHAACADWLNGSGAAVGPLTYLAVLAQVSGAWLPAWFTAIDPPVTLAAGDSLGLPDGAVFSLGGY